MAVLSSDMLDGSLSVFVGAVALGLIHGAEPGHGWPVAAVYAIDTSNRWIFGFISGLLIGIGHLISSIAVVGLFFLLKTYSGIGQFDGLNYVAGVLLILLGIYEYRNGHSHTHAQSENEKNHDHDHDHDHDHEHDYDHDHDDHDHSELSPDDSRGLWGITSAAFFLGFAHEEEFEIIAMCTGSSYCLELMLVYALAVILALVALTMLFIAGFERYEERAERYAEYFPTISAAVLILMGLGFITGVL
nr:hypothetical protein [Halocatena marina]